MELELEINSTTQKNPAKAFIVLPVSTKIQHYAQLNSHIRENNA